MFFRTIFLGRGHPAPRKFQLTFKQPREIKRYNNQTINYNQVKTSGSQESVKTISRQSETINNVTKEIKVYTESDHLSKVEFETRELYEKLKDGILNLDDNVSLQAKKQTIGFKIENNIFCDIAILLKSLKIYINLKSGDLQDAKNIARDVSNVGHWGNGSYEIKMNDTETWNIF